MCSITKKDNGKLACYDTFEVEQIAYNDKQEICGLSIINAKTRKRVFAWALGENVVIPAEEPTRAATSAEPAQNTFIPRCADCKKEITDREHDYAVKYFKRPLCRDCQKRVKNESENR